MPVVNAVTWGGLRGRTWRELGTWANLLGTAIPQDPPAEPVFGPPVWYIVNAMTGGILKRMPEVKCKISDIIGQYTSTSATIPIPTDTMSEVYLTPREIEELFQPWRRVLVRVGAGLPMWAGIIVGEKGGTDATLEVPVATLGVYLDVRVVEDHDFVQADEATIFSALIADANIEGLNILVDAPATGLRHDRTYRRKDGASVFKRVDELSNVQGGSEWHIGPRWKPDRSGFLWVAEMRPQIGVVAGASIPVFTARPAYSSTSANEATYTQTKDFSRENFANHITATGDGQGDAQPESAPARSAALDAGEEPRVERRFNPGSGIVEQSTLDAHALAELAVMENGAVTVEVVARADVEPIYGLHWRLGQVVEARLTGHRHPPDPDHPDRPGLVFQRRAMGFDLDDTGTKITPKW